MEEKLYKFLAIPQSERYYDENSNWGVYSFITSDEIPKFYNCYKDPFADEKIPAKGSMLVGKMQRLTIGVEYQVEAVCEYDNKYKSYRYSPRTVTANIPKTEDQQIAYLKTQVTVLQAKNILEIYPNVVDDVIHNRPIDCAKIKGVGETTWKRIKQNIIDNYVISDILIMLQPLGVTYSMISKLISEEPNPELLKQKLLENPYIMTKIKGFGFNKVDMLALKLNPDMRVSKHRTIAFLKYYLEWIGNNEGHTYITETQLLSAVKDNIPECVDLYISFSDRQKERETFLHFNDNKVGLLSTYTDEKAVVDILETLDNIPSKFNINIKDGIAKAELEQGFQYTEEQCKEIEKACNTPVVLITGLAGTGKSSVLRGLVKIYEKYSITACALSAKAAIRITEATGIRAGTIHKLLGFNKTGFMYDAENRLPYEIVILDEASMVNTKIFYSLVSAVKEGAKLIIVGDDGQLPPIGTGNIFHDLLELERFNCCKLTKILRQANKSGIISDSAKIRSGENPLISPQLRVVTGELQDMTYMFRENREGMRDLAIKLFLKAAETDGYNETIILTPCKQDRINSSSSINSMIQDIIIPTGAVDETKYGVKTFRVGAKVIQRANDYEKNVFNGEIGYITKIEEIKQDGKSKETITTVDFGDKQICYSHGDLLHLELAYCLTCHLAQGSGFKNVIIVIDNTHYKLLDRCMLYTAITRAKTKCALIAEPSAFSRCLSVQASSRNTWLSVM